MKHRRTVGPPWALDVGACGISLPGRLLQAMCFLALVFTWPLPVTAQTEGGTLEAGTWTGELVPMNHPDQGVPLRFHVSRVDGSPRIEIRGPGELVLATRDVTVSDTGVAFLFDEPEAGVPLRCTLRYDDEGVLTGRCTDPEGKWADLTMRPAPERPPVMPFHIDPDSASWTACDPVDPSGCQVTLLYRDPSTGGAQYLLRTPPGAEIRGRVLHRRMNEAQLVVQGTFEVRVGDEDPRALHPGSYLFIPAGTVHGGRCVSDDACMWYEVHDGPLDMVRVEVPLAEVPPDRVDVEPVAMDPATAARLVGRYLAGNDTIEVSLASGRPRLETGFWKAYDLVPVRGGRWVMGVFDGDELVSIAGPRARIEVTYEDADVRSLRLVLMPEERLEFEAERIR